MKQVKTTKYIGKNNHLLLWTSKGASIEGVPTPDELKKTPGYPSLKRLQKGPVAVIECTQRIVFVLLPGFIPQLN